MFHAAGEIAGKAFYKRRQSTERERFIYGLFSSPSWDAVNISVEINILLYRKVSVKAEALTHIANFFFNRLRIPPL